MPLQISIEILCLAVARFVALWAFASQLRLSVARFLVLVFPSTDCIVLGLRSIGSRKSGMQEKDSILDSKGKL